MVELKLYKIPTHQRANGHSLHAQRVITRKPKPPRPSLQDCISTPNALRNWDQQLVGLILEGFPNQLGLWPSGFRAQAVYLIP